MNPGLRRKMFAGHRRRNPHPVQRIPYIPFSGLVEVALGSPRPARAAERLVYVELKRLGSVSIIDVKPQVISEMAHAVSASKGIPVKLIGIGVWSAHGELR